jgi:hypothetical protein
MPPEIADTSEQGTGLDAAAQAFERILDREDGTPERPKKVPAAEAPAKAEAASADDDADETPEEATDEEAEDDAAEDDSDAEEEDAEEGDDEPQQKVTVKIDGKTEELPLDEVVKGYQRQADYSRKTEALARDKQSFFEQEVVPVREERQQYATLLSALEQQLSALAQSEPDWDRLWQDDPIEWVKQRELKKDRETRISAARFEQDRLQRQTAEENIRQHQSMLQQERAKLAELVPEAADKAKWEGLRVKLREFGAKAGYAPEEIAQAYDARAIALMVKAMKYDELMSAKKPTPTPRAAIPAVQQGKAVAPKAVTQHTRNKQRLAKTGKLSDAAAVFEGLI